MVRVMELEEVVSSCPVTWWTERFPEPFVIRVTAEGWACQRLVAANIALEVTWVQSYVRDDKRKTFCIYDAGSPEAIRRAAARSGLPVHRITRVSVPDPYFHR